MTEFIDWFFFKSWERWISSRWLIASCRFSFIFFPVFFFFFFFVLSILFDSALFFQLFDALRRDSPNALKKLVAVAGDVTLPGLGLSPSDLQLLCDNVSVVFNSAATIKFDEELRKAVEMNVKGPKKLMEICHQMKHLEVAFIAVTIVSKMLQTITNLLIRKQSLILR